MDSYGRLFGKYPAVIKAYDQLARQCRIEIPGITDGGDVLPIAEIMYPVGDKSKVEVGKVSTEIEILAGDLVWVEFIGGDPRYPLIVGYRNPNQNNSINWRRHHHANIEMLSDHILQQAAGDKMLLTVGAVSVEMLPSKMTLTVGGSSIEITPSGIKLAASRIDLN